jgi:hypothetical protein
MYKFICIDISLLLLVVVVLLLLPQCVWVALRVHVHFDVISIVDVNKNELHP